MGLFKQVFTDHKQDEQKNPWIEKDSWLNDTGISFEVPFKDFSLRSHLYDIDVTGYEGGSNKLHLFDVETVNEDVYKRQQLRHQSVLHMTKTSWIP